jgi:hypothetical protein
MDRYRIPESLYNRLVVLLGRKEAERIIEEEHYNYMGLVLLVYNIVIWRYIKKNPLVGILIVIFIGILIYKYFTDFQSW